MFVIHDADHGADNVTLELQVFFFCGANAMLELHFVLKQECVECDNVTLERWRFRPLV